VTAALTPAEQEAKRLERNAKANARNLKLRQKHLRSPEILRPSCALCLWFVEVTDQSEATAAVHQHLIDCPVRAASAVAVLAGLRA
jgi:hypothetical protein